VQQVAVEPQHELDRETANHAGDAERVALTGGAYAVDARPRRSPRPPRGHHQQVPKHDVEVRHVTAREHQPTVDQLHRSIAGDQPR
jgi:hypothetical protein